jgi:predicted ATP-grasp superfamily ATP-dependent carboligase
VVLGFARGLAGDEALGARGFRYCGSLYPLEVEGSVVKHLDAFAQAATRGFGLRGVNGIDFVLRDGEAHVLELNPRYSGSMEVIERALGRSIFEIHRGACDGALPAAPAPPAARVFGKAILWARGDRVAGDTLPWLARDDVRDVPFPGDRFRRGQPICTVFAEGRDAGDCYERLVAAASRFDRELLAPDGALPVSSTMGLKVRA